MEADRDAAKCRRRVVAAAFAFLLLQQGYLIATQTGVAVGPKVTQTGASR
jgi:hypothetical protein